jgi:hypothetical protein
MGTRGNPELPATDGAMAAVGGWVVVTRADGVDVEGVLYTIDPETGAAFVINREGASCAREGGASSDTHQSANAPVSFGVVGAVTGINSRAAAAATEPAAPSGDAVPGHAAHQADDGTGGDADPSACGAGASSGGGGGGGSPRPGAERHVVATPRLLVAIVPGHAVRSVRPLPPDGPQHDPAAAVTLVALAEATLRLPGGGRDNRSRRSIGSGGGSSVAPPPAGTSSNDDDTQALWAMAKLAEHRVPCVQTDGVIIILDGAAVIPPPYVYASLHAGATVMVVGI